MKRRNFAAGMSGLTLLSLGTLTGCQTASPTSDIRTTSTQSRAPESRLDRYRRIADADGALLITGTAEATSAFISGRDAFSERPVALASVSKIVTGYIMRRAEMDGALSYSDTVGNLLSDSPLLSEFPEISAITVSQLVRHQSGLAPVTTYDHRSVASRLRAATRRTVSENTYANDNYTILTLIADRIFGSFDASLERYLRSEGLTSFRIGRYHGLPAYAGAGELEATPSDMHGLILRSAPLSVSAGVGRFGDGWFHGPDGLALVGQHDIRVPGRRLRWQTEAYWSNDAGGTGSFLVMDGLTNASSPIPAISETLLS